MQDLIAMLAYKNVSQRKPRKSSDQHALHLCYGKIGISAVAAAARYQSSAKDTGLPPVLAQLDHRGTWIA